MPKGRGSNERRRNRRLKHRTFGRGTQAGTLRDETKVRQLPVKPLLHEGLLTRWRKKLWRRE